MANISVTLVGKEETQARFLAMPDAARGRLHTALAQIGINLAAYVKADKLSGQVLKNQTGTLRRSINFEQVQEGASDFVDVGSRNLPYARIHEFGGTINIPEITPKNARALHFANGQFAMRAQAHTVTMPERSFMRSSLDEKRGEITTRLESALQGLWR